MKMKACFAIPAGYPEMFPKLFLLACSSFSIVSTLLDRSHIEFRICFLCQGLGHPDAALSTSFGPATMDFFLGCSIMFIYLKQRSNFEVASQWAFGWDWQCRRRTSCGMLHDLTVDMLAWHVACKRVCRIWR